MLSDQQNGAPADLYLASASPRRRQLLAQVGVIFTVVPVDVDEALKPSEAPVVYVQRLARAKALAGWRHSQAKLGLPVLGADTSVICDDHILGKPSGRDDALSMLMRLSGRTHQVVSSVAVAQAGVVKVRTVVTEVTFRQLSLRECEAYWETGEPRDKAGAYGIQGLAAVFVSRLEGSYSNVVGLPLLETAELLAQFSVPIWRSRAVETG